MMNTMIKKSPNQVPPIPRRSNEIRDEEINNDDSSPPLDSAILVAEYNTHSDEVKRSRLDPFRPIHPQCNHISYGCLTMIFLVFVGMAVLLKTYLPDIHPLIPSIESSDSPSVYPSHSPRITTNEVKKLIASDGSDDDYFGLIESKHLLRGSDLNDEKETGNKDEETRVINQSPKRMLEVGTKRLQQFIGINIGCCDDNDDYIESNDGVESNDDDESNDEESTKPTPSPSSLPTVTRSNPPSMYPSHPPSTSSLPTVTRSNPPSMYPSHSPSITRYEQRKFIAPDGLSEDRFGTSCSMSDELVVIGANGVDGENYNEGAAYLFHLDRTEMKKLTPNDGENNDMFGVSVSMDEKVVVGSLGGYISVFSREGIYERTIRCDDCNWFGEAVATHGNLIVTKGYDYQNSIEKLFVFSTEDGQLLKSFEHEDTIDAVAISEQFIVSTFGSWRGGKTSIYSNSSPDFPKVAEIDREGREVAVSGDRIVIGYHSANGYDGAAYLYDTDGTLVKTLDRQNASSGSHFGSSVAINDDKVFVGAQYDADAHGHWSGSVFIYSAVTGEFIKRDSAPAIKFGRSVCASHSHFMVGAPGFEAAYLFQSFEE